MALAAVAALPAMAQTAADTGALDEVVVTAQKRPERLKDIPVAASVVNTEILARANASDITDLNKLVPSVQLKGTYNGRVPLGLRGISTNANEGAVGLTSGVAIQIDGVPVPPDSFAANALDDIAQIEVLKGPQATLGGRTASAGVINIVTNGPTKEFKGRASVTFTNDNERRANVSLSGPISDSVGFSLSGFGSHTQYLVEDVRTGVNADSTNAGARGKLRFESGENFDATIMARYSRFHSDGGTFTHQYLTPGAPVFPFIPSEFNGPGGSPSYFGFSQSVAFPGVTIGYGNVGTATINDDMFSTWKDTDASLNLNYRQGNLTFSSITAQQREKQAYSQDVTLASLFFFDVLTGGFAPHWGNVQDLTGDVKQFSQEFKVASDTNQPVSFLAGAFYSDNKVISTNLRTFVGAPQSFETHSDTKTYAVYGRLTGKLGETRSVTGGLRYNNDKIAFQKTQFFDPANGAFQGCHSITVPGPNGPQVVTDGPTCVLATNRDSSNALVGDVSFQQRFGQDAMAYASFTRGYKPKAYNTAADFALPTDNPNNISISTLTQQSTGAEKINSFEVGLKTSLLDHRATLNLAAFRTVYNDYQVQIFPIVAGGLSPLTLDNAGKARTQGLEADFNLRAGDTTLAVAAAYIDAKFIHFTGASCYGDQTALTGCVGGVQDLSGKPMPDSPKFKANVDIDHRFALNDSTDIVIGANLAHRTSALFQANNNPQARQPAITLLNLSAGVELFGGKANATLFMNNVTDEFYLTNAEDFFSGLFGPGPINGPANDVIGQPARDGHRYGGVRFSVKF
jgi:iron complex outermembrane receptor protein